MSSKTFKLKSNDNQCFEVSYKCAQMCQTIRVPQKMISNEFFIKVSLYLQDMLESMFGCYDDGTEIPLPNVSSKPLRKIVEWLEHW